MNARGYAQWGLLFLIVGLIGFFIFEWNSIISSDIKVRLQAGSVVYMCLLSLAIFYSNNKITLIKYTNESFVAHFELFAYIIVIFGVCALEGLSLIGGNGVFIPPLFLAALAIGFLFAGRAINLS